MVKADFYEGPPSLPGSRYLGGLETPSGHYTSAFFKAVIFALRVFSKSGKDSWASVYVDGEYYSTMLYSPVLEGVSITREHSLEAYWMDKGAIHR